MGLPRYPAKVALGRPSTRPTQERARITPSRIRRSRGAALASCSPYAGSVISAIFSAHRAYKLADHAMGGLPAVVDTAGTELQGCLARRPGH